MAIEVTTSGSTGYARRSPGSPLDYNGNYTVLFCLYVPAAGINSAFLWGISGASSSNSGTNPGNRYDSLRGSGAGLFKLMVNSTGSNATDYFSGVTPSSNWYNVSIRRTSATSLILRVNGSDSAGVGTLDVSAREASAHEFFAADALNGSYAANGVKITNYKSWSRALSTAEIDAEFAATAFSNTTNKYSGSPMGDESTLAGNNTADGSGTAWTFGAGLSAGTNNPGVTYGGASGVPKSTKFLMMGIG